MGELKRPPIGVVPAYGYKNQVEAYIREVGGVHMDSIHKSRMVDLSSAIIRYAGGGFEINRDWIDEYNSIVKYLNSKK